MYDGWAAFNGLEVFSSPRAWAYADAGFKPTGVKVDRSLGDCPLWLALGTDQYGTPISDPAPWVTDDDVTLEFTGFIPMKVTGLSDSTVSTGVVDRLGAGATFDTPRQGPKTLGVTVLAVASTDAGMEAGLAWLRSVLHPGVGCGDPGCNGYPLTVLTSCPADPEDEPEDAVECLGDFRRTFRDVRTIDGPRVIEQVGDDETNDAILATIEWTWVAGDPYRYKDGFVAAAGVTSDATGTPAVEDGVTVSGAGSYDKPNLFTNEGFETDAAGWQAYTSGASGVALARSTTLKRTGAAAGRVTVTTAAAEVGIRQSGGTTVTEVNERVNHSFTGFVRAGQSMVPGAVIVKARLEWFDSTGTLLRTDSQDPLTLDLAENDLPGHGGGGIGSGGVIPRTSGPWVSDAFWRGVTYTAVPPKHARYLRGSLILDGTSNGQVFYFDDLALTGPDQCPKPVPASANWASGCGTGKGIAPPEVPTIHDLSRGNPKGYRRRTVTIPADVLGAGPIDLTWVLTADDDTPKAGVRVRVHDLTDLDECAFVTEFTVDYLPPGATMTLTADRVTVTRPGRDPVDGASNVHGAYGGSFLIPPLGCGRGYRIAVDLPRVYPASCSFDEADPRPMNTLPPRGLVHSIVTYDAGSDQGVLTWGVLVDPREA